MTAQEWADRISSLIREAQNDGFTVELYSCGECTADMGVWTIRPETGEDFAEVNI
jgi:hypothetical protein